jgi:2-acylglycerol O-acyltransferase 2
MHPSQYRVPENVRLYSDGMHKQYEPSLITKVIAVVTLGLYVGIPHILLALLFFSWWRPAAITLALLLLTLLLPAKPLRVPSVLNSYVFLCWRRYFKFSYLFEQSLDCYQVCSSSNSSSSSKPSISSNVVSSLACMLCRHH